MEKEYLEPIIYTVENKNGIHEYSDSFEVNDTVKIRIIILHPVIERNPLMDIVKNISNKDKNIPFDNSATAVFGYCSTINDLPVNEFLNNTNDLKFELIENSKIAVMLLFKHHEPPLRNWATPTSPTMPIYEFNQEQKFEPTPRWEFEIERIDGATKFTPEKLELNKTIGFVRTTSIENKVIDFIPFKYKGETYNPEIRLDPYGNPNYTNEFRIYGDGLFIDNISEFNFDEVPDRIKLKVELFEHKPFKIILKPYGK